MNDDVTVSRADLADAEEVLALIKRAFGPVAEQYRDHGLPPLTETLEAHRARYATAIVLKAVDATGRLVGTIQGEMRDGGTCYVARLAVDPPWQRRGIARALARALEAEFPEARRFELFTGHLSEDTLRLYRSLGYEETRRDVESDRLTLVWMQKTR